jgi:hypothetical protein
MPPKVAFGYRFFSNVIKILFKFLFVKRCVFLFGQREKKKRKEKEKTKLSNQKEMLLKEARERERLKHQRIRGLILRFNNFLLLKNLKNESAIQLIIQISLLII